MGNYYGALNERLRKFTPSSTALMYRIFIANTRVFSVCLRDDRVGVWQIADNFTGTGDREKFDRTRRCTVESP